MNAEALAVRFAVQRDCLAILFSLLAVAQVLFCRTPTIIRSANPLHV